MDFVKGSRLETRIWVVEYTSLNRLNKSVFMAGPKPMPTEFGIHQRLESLGGYFPGFFGIL